MALNGYIGGISVNRLPYFCSLNDQYHHCLSHAAIFALFFCLVWIKPNGDISPEMRVKCPIPPCFEEEFIQH